MENVKMKKAALVIFVILSFVWGCKKNGNSTQGYVYRVPDQIEDGWETASLSSVGIDDNLINNVLELTRANTFENIHSILIVKQGKLVLEEYFPGYNSNERYINFSRSTKHEVQSASKSVRSALIGIAIDNGFIESVDEKLISFFPEYVYLNDEQKDKVTLKDVLTMSTGFEWHENDVPFTDPGNTLMAMYQKPSSVWSRCVLEQPVIYEPGTRWEYNTGSSLMLSDILTKVTGMRADIFSDLYLFNKMESGDIRDRWPPLGSGLLPRDMAKFGYIFLNNGYWKETQIVSESWIEESTQRYFGLGPTTYYGYLWWIKDFYTDSGKFEAFYASGNGGQYIFVFPALDVVVVFTGGNFNSQLMNQPLEMLENYIIPAVN